MRGIKGAVIEITLKTTGAEAIEKELSGLVNRLDNLRPLLKAIGDRVVRQTQERFNKGGPAPDGAAWAKVKRPDPKARGILRISDHLRDSIRYQMVGDDAVAIGTNKVYAAIHQLGGRTAAHDILPVRKKALKTPFGIFKKVKHPGSVIPARPYLGISAENSEELIGIVSEYLAEAFK